jgi:hypothetical protein
MSYYNKEKTDKHIFYIVVKEDVDEERIVFE